MTTHLKIANKTRCGIVITPNMEKEKRTTLNVDEVTCKNCQKVIRKTVKQDEENISQKKESSITNNSEDLNKEQ